MIDVTPDPKPVASEPKEPKPLKKTQGFRTSPKFLRDDFRFRVLHEFGGRCIMLGHTSSAVSELPSPSKGSARPGAATGEAGEPSTPRPGNGHSQHSRPLIHECDGPLDPCHIIPKQVLRKLGLPETVVYDYRNGAAACRRAHRRNDDGLERFPRELLPPSVEEFAKAHGLSYLLDKSYPTKELT